MSVTGLDLRAVDDWYGDILTPQSFHGRFQGCTGVIHLASVSRVIWGETYPDKCWATNVRGTQNILDQIQLCASLPWIIFASSREVYGQPSVLPTNEDTILSPVNTYGLSKLEGERRVSDSCRFGMRSGIIRLSNVYGSTTDHPDRVVPAFAKAAVDGNRLRVDGADNTFDFTHLDDTVRGIVALALHFENNGASTPPIQFVTGQPTTLQELALKAKNFAKSDSDVIQSPSRTFDVSNFYGDPSRARYILGWEPKISIDEGLARLINDFTTAT